MVRENEEVIEHDSVSTEDLKILEGVLQETDRTASCTGLSIISSDETLTLDVGGRSAQQDLPLSFDVEMTQPSKSQATQSLKARGLLTSGDAQRRLRLDALHQLPNFNPRVRSEKFLQGIKDLADQMGLHGYLNEFPIGVIAVFEEGQEKVYYWDGHRRMLAVHMHNERVRAKIEAGTADEDKDVLIESVPVEFARQGTTIEDLQERIGAANSGVQLTAYEKGILAMRMLNSKKQYDQAAIAVALGISQPYLARLLTLMSSPRELQDMVASEKVSATYAMNMLRDYKDKALAKIKAQLSVSAAKGQTRVMPKDSIDAVSGKVFKKHANTVELAFTTVQNDPAFTSLAKETKELIEMLMSEVTLARKKAEGKTDGENVNKTDHNDTPASNTANAESADDTNSNQTAAPGSVHAVAEQQAAAA